ncbi:MAG: Gfo/Idh/MocA family oxidoreductase [Verrucomicrobiales bacterium]|jgi:predicted dehydrogenase|nr:Gfo/Idh/MocA family oxidoreductase [Verrucomicrobiales bacterium]
MQQLRLGIIGVGNMGSHYAKLVLNGQVPRCQLTAVCDTDAAKLKLYPSAATFTDSDELLASGTVDAVLIATPHYAHTTIGIAALTAGLHVLVEKPLSVHKADCQRLLAAHRDPRQVFATVFNQRTDPRYRAIRDLIVSGRLGSIQRVQWTVTDWFRSAAYYASGGWRATWAGEGGGVLLNQSVHNLDLYQWLFGLPQRVRAVCHLGKYHSIEVEDEVTAIFEHADGATGVFVTSTGEAPGVNRLEIAADRGRVLLEGDQLTFWRNRIATSVHSRATKQNFLPPPSYRNFRTISDHGPQHLGVLRNFVSAILRGTKLIAPAADGEAAVELINAMLLSSFKNSAVILPLSAAEYTRLLRRLISSRER